MQLSMLIDSDDFSGEVPVMGLSGGINSAALLCYLATMHPAPKRPSRLLLYYAHLREHSPDTFPFVADCVRYARRHFEEVKFRMHRDSMCDWIRRNNMIPHPTVSPCTWDLKIVKLEAWAASEGATVDLIGYVRNERRRIERQQKKGLDHKRYPIAHLSNNDCMSLVDQEIGWHPAIYDLRRDDGRPAFRNNNCLPCKNMHKRQLKLVQLHYPDYWQRAVAAADDTGTYWGRAEEYAGDPCAVCAFD